MQNLSTSSDLNFSSSASLGLTSVYFKFEVEFEIELYSRLTVNFSHFSGQCPGLCSASFF